MKFRHVIATALVVVIWHFVRFHSIGTSVLLLLNSTFLQNFDYLKGKSGGLVIGDRCLKESVLLEEVKVLQQRYHQEISQSLMGPCKNKDISDLRNEDWASEIRYCRNGAPQVLAIVSSPTDTLSAFQLQSFPVCPDEHFVNKILKTFPSEPNHQSSITHTTKSSIPSVLEASVSRSPETAKVVALPRPPRRDALVVFTTCNQKEASIAALTYLRQSLDVVDLLVIDDHSIDDTVEYVPHCEYASKISQSIPHIK